MSEEKVDLSCLDPARDAQRWDNLVESIATKAWAARQRRLTVTHQLVAWARPSLLAAAAIALLPWLGALANEWEGEPESTTQADPAYVLAKWAEQDERPTAAKILQVLGERHDTE